MDGRTGLVVVCAVAGGAWALLVAAVLVGRLRARRHRRQVPVAAAGEAEWQVPKEALDRIRLGVVEGDDETRSILLRALRSDEPELRLASVTTLGRLGHRFEWAIDLLVEALAEEVDDPVRVAAQLDRLAPRAGSRLPPLLGHPSSVVRFYAVRLLAQYGALASRHVPRMTEDTSANVRAAALETLRAVASGEALRCALRLLDDPHPLVRAHASRTAAAIAPLTAAPFLVPLLGDRSWWVREAVREALVAAGKEVSGSVESALHEEDTAVRTGAALVLQDIGIVDALVDDADLGQLERILDAGGPRLREAATDRKLGGLRLGATAARAAEAVP
jgi:HEAT repeat protein